MSNLERRRGRNGFPLVTNPTLETVAATIASTSADWEGLFRQVHDSGRRMRAVPHIAGHFGEVHVNNIIRELASQPGSEIVADPIEPGRETITYKFVHDPVGDIYVQDKVSGQDLFQYDTVFEAEGVPVLGEVKVIRPGRTKHISSTMQNSTIKRRFAPIQEAYAEEGVGQFSYMMVTNSDALSAESSAAASFKRRGGILVRMPHTYEEFAEKADEFITRFGRRVRRSEIAEEDVYVAPDTPEPRLASDTELIIDDEEEQFHQTQRADRQQRKGK